MKSPRAYPRLLFICSAPVALLASACAGTDVETANSPKTETPEELAAKGLEAAELFPGLASLCDLDMVFRDVNVPRSANGGEERGDDEPREERGARSRGSERESLEAMQVFDDLYFLGNSGVAAWLVGSEEDGYVLFDALNTNEEAERDIIGGMEALGLDPSKIRRFIVSHGHGDHYGGHRYLSERLGLPVTMSAPDWALARTLGVHPRFGPAPLEGDTVEDGEVIELGDTVIRIYVTSAHTPGTISPIITVHDGSVAHNAVLWGGTGLNFGPDEKRLREYADSAARMRELSRELGVDIFMSNHPARDGSGKNMRRLAERGAGDRHPFVLGPDALKVFDILEFCPRAQAERIATGADAAATDGS